MVIRGRRRTRRASPRHPKLMALGQEIMLDISAERYRPGIGTRRSNGRASARITSSTADKKPLAAGKDHRGCGFRFVDIENERQLRQSSSQTDGISTQPGTTRDRRLNTSLNRVRKSKLSQHIFGTAPYRARGHEYPEKLKARGDCRLLIAYLLRFRPRSTATCYP